MPDSRAFREGRKEKREKRKENKGKLSFNLNFSPIWSKVGAGDVFKGQSVLTST